MTDDECPLISSFLARQSILLGAGLLFILFTYLRKLLGYETRDIKTFAADCSKQALQQGFGGLLMAAVAVHLQHGGLYDALAWYGGEYPFEIILTTIFTRVFRYLSELLARRCYESASARQQAFWLPMLHMGRYGPEDGPSFSCSWYLSQLVQAVLLIGVPARLLSIGLILLSTLLPTSIAPVRLVASAWFSSGMACVTRTALILYVVPLVGDAVQFVIIDQIQKVRVAMGGDRRRLLGAQGAFGGQGGSSTTPGSSPSETLT